MNVQAFMGQRGDDVLWRTILAVLERMFFAAMVANVQTSLRAGVAVDTFAVVPHAANWPPLAVALDIIEYLDALCCLGQVPFPAGDGFATGG